MIPRPSRVFPIFLLSNDDLFFAQGYVMAQDRLADGDDGGAGARETRSRRLARKPLMMMCAAPGPRSAAPGMQRVGQLSPDRTGCSRHGDGHNAYIASHADNLPVEFKLTGVKPSDGQWLCVGLNSTSATRVQATASFSSR